MTPDQVQLLMAFGGCAVGIPIVAVEWMREHDASERVYAWLRQRRTKTVDELEARTNGAPLAAVTVRPRPTASNMARHLTHVDGRPLRLTPVQERLVDVINGDGS